MTYVLYKGKKVCQLRTFDLSMWSSLRLIPIMAHMACMKSEIPIKHVFPVVVSYTIFYKQLLKLKNEVGMAMLKSKQE